MDKRIINRIFENMLYDIEYIKKITYLIKREWLLYNKGAIIIKNKEGFIWIENL